MLLALAAQSLPGADSHLGRQAPQPPLAIPFESRQAQSGVFDEVNALTPAQKQRAERAAAAIVRQTGGRFFIVFAKAATTDEAIAAAVRIREERQREDATTPIGVVAYGTNVRAYSRTTTYDAKLGIEKLRTAWDGVREDNFVERAIRQLESLAGASTPTLVVEGKIGPAGGKLISQDGSLELVVPPLAVAADQSFKVAEVGAGSQGRIVHVTGPEGLLARPATLKFRIPEGTDIATVIAAGQVEGALWMVHPAKIDPAQRTLTCSVGHFSNQGWFGLNRKQHQILGATLYSLAGGTLLVLAEYAAVGAVSSLSWPVAAAIALFGATGWFAGGAEYDTLMKQGFTGPIPVEGYDVFWKPEQVQGPSVVALIHANEHRILTWIKEGDGWTPQGRDRTFQIELPNTPGLTLSDIKAVKVPAGIASLCADLSETKRWYDRNAFAPKDRIPVLLTNDLGKLPSGEPNAGEFEGTYLKLNVELLGSAKGHQSLRATMAHETLHVIADKNGYREPFLGCEEAVAVALESIVWPGANDGMTTNAWNRTGPVMANGLKGNGQGEGFTTPERRGYLLWPFPKFVYHRHGTADLKALADGTMDGALFESMFRSYVRALTNNEDGLDKESDSDDGRGKIATGWPVPLTEVAISSSTNVLATGVAKVPPLAPTGVRVMTFKLGDPELPNTPVVVRRRTPEMQEEIHVLKPMGSPGSAVNGGDRKKDDVLSERGIAVTPTDWVARACQLPVVLASVKGGEPGENPLLAYTLDAPKSVTVLAPQDARVAQVKWIPPGLNGVPAADALWGYRLMGRLPGGDIRVIAELRFRPDKSPKNLSAVGGSRNAITIEPIATEASVPADGHALFEAFGMASVDLVAGEGSAQLLSPIRWASAEADTLLQELQQMTGPNLTLNGRRTVKEDSSGSIDGGNGTAVLRFFGAVGGNILDEVLGTAKSVGVNLGTPSLTWSGPRFQLSASFGPKPVSSKAREGTTNSQVTRKLEVSGRYDPASRSLVEVVAVYEATTTTTFVPDPNWKPRSTVESLYAPKPFELLDRRAMRFRFDRVPFLRKETDRSGNAFITFGIEGPNLSAPGCTAEVEVEWRQTDKPSVKQFHIITAQPPLKGVTMYQPGVWVMFMRAKV